MVDYDALGEIFTGKFLKFSVINPIKGQFVNVRVEDDPFAKKKGDQRLVYTLLVDGEEKELGSRSSRLFRAFKKAKVKEGDIVRIERHGLAFETDYEVTVEKK